MERGSCERVIIINFIKEIRKKVDSRRNVSKSPLQNSEFYV